MKTEETSLSDGIYVQTDQSTEMWPLWWYEAQQENVQRAYLTPVGCLAGG
jgi:hypothetical protein